MAPAVSLYAVIKPFKPVTRRLKCGVQGPVLVDPPGRISAVVEALKLREVRQFLMVQLRTEEQLVRSVDVAALLRLAVVHAAVAH